MVEAYLDLQTQPELCNISVPRGPAQVGNNRARCIRVQESPVEIGTSTHWKLTGSNIIAPPSV
jgi:hypothetical protein